MFTTNGSTYPFNTANCVVFKMDALHILNDIYRSDVYNLVAQSISPAGLVALLLSIPGAPNHEEIILNTLEIYDKGSVMKLSSEQYTDFQIFCDSLVEEIDAQTNGIFQAYGCATSCYFFEWTELSFLSVIASKNAEENNALQSWSLQQASQFRYYNGPYALPGGSIEGIYPF